MRPTKRAHCQGEGLCPYALCRYNLAVDVSQFGSLIAAGQSAMTLRPKRYDFGPWSDKLTEAMIRSEYSCALDVADRGEHTLTEVGALLGVCRERVRQIEETALGKLGELLGEAEVRAMLEGAHTGIAVSPVHQDFGDRSEPC